jgi:hypothetical protein
METPSGKIKVLRRTIMKYLVSRIAGVVTCTLAVATMTSTTTRANNDDDDRPMRFSTHLSSFNEVPPKGVGGSGTFDAKLSPDGSILSWTFTWTGLTGPPLFAHIHFGQRGVNANVMTFFCGGPKGSTIPAKPDCPQTTSGSISGTTTAADIVALNTGASDQGLNANDFETFLRALRHGDGYANMHTTRFPFGEIRGQIAAHNEHERDDDHR